MSYDACARTPRATLQGAPLCARTRRDVVAGYTELHDGLAPDRVFARTGWRPPSGRVGGSMRIAEIQYDKRIPGEVPAFHHPFKPHARPRFGRDARGRLHIYAGRYVVTDHGIEDLPAASQRAENFPGRPRALIDLGKLEWIRYIEIDGAGRESTGVYTFTGPDGPTLATSNGDLYLLGGDAEATRNNPSRTVTMRANPATEMTTTDTAKSVFLSSLRLGIPAVAVGYGANMALRNVAMNGYAKAALKAGGGLLLATLAQMALPDYPTVAASIGVGGVGAGMIDAITTYRAAHPTAPGGQVYALPPGYVAMGSLAPQYQRVA